MGSLMQDLKRQASFFLREKMKTARLVLTDVTPAQLLTEDLINGDSLAQDVHAMRLISRASFEVDDYDRIVHILHQSLCVREDPNRKTDGKEIMYYVREHYRAPLTRLVIPYISFGHVRLSKFDTWNWRVSYKALVLLEHLLTHGPQRIAEEFECHEDAIRDMANFQYVDHKGFNWGTSVKNKSERVMNLLEDRSYLKEERARAMKLTVGIKGFGSFNHQESFGNGIDHDGILRSKSLLFSGHHDLHNHDAALKARLLESDEYTKLLVSNVMAENDNTRGCSHVVEEDHPFWDKEHQTRASLLSSV